MAGPEETPIVHFSIELDPTSFGLETDEHRSKFYTTLDVTVEATNSDGTLVHSTARSTFIELTPRQVDEIQAAPVAYQDDFPLVPGTYTSVLNALGDSHQRLGDEEKAKRYFERSLELDPTQDAVKNRLTRMERSP